MPCFTMLVIISGFVIICSCVLRDSDFWQKAPVSCVKVDHTMNQGLVHAMRCGRCPGKQDWCQRFMKNCQDMISAVSVDISARYLGWVNALMIVHAFWSAVHAPSLQRSAAAHGTQQPECSRHMRAGSRIASASASPAHPSAPRSSQGWCLTGTAH